ncbi:M14 family metallopeptidase [Tundrisphaera lichenicola]|uniref:M14 family metallopeptidase n=1 Tax=Tundrisphaera lichenicola TaxID=2029860 RepID=UPI003EBC6C6D
MPRNSTAWVAPIVVLLSVSGLTPAQDALPEELRTVAEKSGFKATARHAEVVRLCEALAKSSPLIRLAELGRSVEGRSIPLMIVADPPVSTPAEARASGKLVVFLFGNIHAGEVDGKEGLPILVREIVRAPEHPLLDHLILAVAPIYNADGNERVAKDNRPGQVGPEEGMGRRTNAEGLDLNRDFMKLEAPESRALVRFLNDWDPSLVIDTHTTNGSHHRYTITYDGPKNPAGDARLIRFSRERLFPEVTASLEKASGYRSFFYGNFEDDHTRWTSFPGNPRFGTTYIGLRNRLSVLSEAYSYATYKDRVLATRDFCRAILEFVSSHRDEIRTLLDDARRSTIEAGRDPSDRVAIRSKARALPEKATVLGFVERREGDRSVSTGEPRDYPCAIEIDFAPELEVARPFAYLVPPGSVKAIDILRAHGIAVETLEAPAKLDVEVSRVDESSRARRPFEGHNLLDITRTTTTRATREVPAGTILVRTAQPLGSLAVTLLEPRSDDGLATWNVFDDELARSPDREFPVLRLPGRAEIATRPFP